MAGDVHPRNVPVENAPVAAKNTYRIGLRIQV